MVYIYIIWCIPWYTVYPIWRHPNRVLFSLWNTIHWNPQSKKNRVFQWEWVYCSEQTDSGVSNTFESKPFGSNHQLGDSYGSWGLKNSHSYGSRAPAITKWRIILTTSPNCSPQPLAVAQIQFLLGWYLNFVAWIHTFVESSISSHFAWLNPQVKAIFPKSLCEKNQGFWGCLAEPKFWGFWGPWLSRDAGQNLVVWAEKNQARKLQEPLGGWRTWV